MAFQSGKNKTGGRKKGTPNKKTKLLQLLLEENDLEPIAGIKEAIAELNEIDISRCTTVERISLSKVKADIYMDLLQYIYPKRKSIDFAEESIEKVAEVFYKAKWGSKNEVTDDTDEDS